jgi:hypothetical protein
LFRQDWKMGYGIDGAHCRLQEKKCHQIISASRSYCRLDGALKLQ